MQVQRITNFENKKAQTRNVSIHHSNYMIRMNSNTICDTVSFKSKFDNPLEYLKLMRKAYKTIIEKKPNTPKQTKKFLEALFEHKRNFPFFVLDTEKKELRNIPKDMTDSSKFSFLVKDSTLIAGSRSIESPNALVPDIENIKMFRFLRYGGLTEMGNCIRFNKTDYLINTVLDNSTGQNFLVGIEAIPIKPNKTTLIDGLRYLLPEKMPLKNENLTLIPLNLIE